MTGREASPIAEGEILAGKYKVEKVLGSGGMGVVVAATHVTLRQKVAIKFLLNGASDEVVERFLREARSAVRLKSDHVAKVLDVGELENGAPYLVMEYLEGNDLAATIRTGGKLPVETAVDYLLQACEAIAEAHQAGIIHRDLKPANLFLTKGADGSPMIKVLDFGISKDAGGETAEDDHGLTKTTAVLGSPSYMSPEQMRSTKTVDVRADIWSLGVILYQLLTRTLPYKAPSFLELVMLVLHEDARPPTSHRNDIPPLLEAAMMRCLERDRDKRFANIAELALAIAPFGGPDAKRSAERAARTQGVATDAPPSKPAAVVDPATADPGPPSGRSGAHLSRTGHPIAISTGESAKPDEPRISQAPPSQTAPSAQTAPSTNEPPASGGRGSGKTGNAWSTADSGASKGAPTERRPASRVWAIGAIGLLCGGAVAWFAIFGVHARATGSTAVSASPSTPSATTASASTAAEGTRETPRPTPRAKATEAQAEAPTPIAEPTEAATTSPRPRPPVSRPRPSDPRPASTNAHPPATSPSMKTKKNPLDLEIQ